MRSLIALSLATGAFLAGSVTAEQQNAPVVGETVRTSSGTIKGHASESRPSVSEYLGIPYARPPHGELRFAPPVGLDWEEGREIDASYWSPDCPYTAGKPIDFPHETDVMKEIIANFGGQKGYPQSEDCLKLNVWSKASENRNKPVLVWIHGGRFTIGSTHSLFYQGQNMADREDVIVVTLQYRLNIFGFPGAPNSTQNLGLLDQRLAIEWVRTNIAAFGGDPSRITIFGQSAGGVSVDYFTYAYREDPIIAGVIPMSGTALSMKPNTPEQSEKYWYTAAEELGCDGGSEEDVMECMRTKPAQDLLVAAGKVPFEPSKALTQPVFHPTIDNEVVFSDYEARSEQGEFVKVPYLAGATANEAGFYAIAAYISNITLSPSQWTLFNGAGFICASSRAASDRASHDVPAWRYIYHGEWPNSIMYTAPGTGNGDSGAYHGSDVSQVLGTAEDVSGGVLNTDDEEEVSAGMMRAWAAFARDPVRGLESEMGWPRYDDEGKKKVVALAYENRVDPTFLDAEDVDGVCEKVGTDTSYAQGAF